MQILIPVLLVVAMGFVFGRYPYYRVEDILRTC